MTRQLIAGTALALIAGVAAQAQDAPINITTYGGAFGAAVNEAFAKPFTAETGIQTTMVDNDNPPATLKAQVEAGNITSDVFDVEQSDVLRLCDEGLIEPIDPALLPAAADGTPATEDYLPQALHDCATAIMVWSTVIAYNTEAFPDGAPTTAADFFDIQKFPGKRGIIKRPKYALEFALLGDGVPADQVYEVLGTPEGVDRAFAKLDTIKNQVIWWEAGAQPPQLLADGEVNMAYAFNGRIFNAAQGEGKPFQIIWDGQIYEMEGWVIPKGANNLEDAKKFVAWTTSPAPQARAAEFISYGPPRKSAAALVGNIEGTDQPMGPHLPTTEENLTNALASNLEFWVDRDAELNERFNSWLAS